MANHQVSFVVNFPDVVTCTNGEFETTGYDWGGIGRCDAHVVINSPDYDYWPASGSEYGGSTNITITTSRRTFSYTGSVNSYDGVGNFKVGYAWDKLYSNETLESVYITVSFNIRSAPRYWQVVITNDPEQGGSTTGAGSYIYANRNTVSISATPVGGYAFDYWTIEGTTVVRSNPYDLTKAGTWETSKKFVTHVVAHFKRAVVLGILCSASDNIILCSNASDTAGRILHGVDPGQ